LLIAENNRPGSIHLFNFVTVLINPAKSHEKIYSSSYSIILIFRLLLSGNNFTI